MARLELGPDFDKAGLDFRQMAQARQGQFVAEHPGPTDLRCEGRNAAWLRLFGTAVDPVGRGREWVRLTADARTYRYRFPPEYAPFAFSASGAIGTIETPDGLRVLARWKRRTRQHDD